MNRKLDSLKIVQAVEDVYQKHGISFEFKDKVALIAYSALLEIQPKNKEEELMKKEYIEGINKFICNFEELEPIISRYLEEQTKKKEQTLIDSIKKKFNYKGDER